MTREEAIKCLTVEIGLRSSSYCDYLAHGGKQDVAEEEFLDSLDMAIAALREQEERSKGCEFCRKFDFKTVAPEIDKYGARLLLATSDCVFPNNRQFKLCPMCGRRLEEVCPGK